MPSITGVWQKTATRGVRAALDDAFGPAAARRRARKSRGGEGQQAGGAHHPLGKKSTRRVQIHNERELGIRPLFNDDIGILPQRVGNSQPGPFGNPAWRRVTAVAPDGGNGPVAPVVAQHPHFSARWLNLWSVRLGTTDRRALERTFAAATRMESARPLASSLDVQSQAKMRRLSFKGSFPRARVPWATVHMDTFRVRKRDLPQTAEGDDIGMPWSLVCVDDHSRFSRVYFAKRKDQIPQLVRMFLDDIGARSLRGSHFIVHNSMQQHIHADGGTELNNAKVTDVLRDFGLGATVTSAPDSPSANGLAETFVGILQRDARARMALVGLRADLWHYAFWDSSAKRNLIASRRVLDSARRTVWVSPYQLAMGEAPDMAHVVAFGARCCVLTSDAEQRSLGKLSLRTADGIVLGWAGEGVQVDGPATRMILGYVVLLDEGRVVISRNVRIDERQLVLRGGVTPWSSSPTEPSIEPAPGQTVAAKRQTGDMDTGEPVDLEDPNGVPEQTMEEPGLSSPLAPMHDAAETAFEGNGWRSHVGDGVYQPREDASGTAGDESLAGGADGEHFDEVEIGMDNRVPLPRARDNSGLSRAVRMSTLSQRAERMYACEASIEDASLPVWNGTRVQVPQTWDQAMGSPLAEKWREAVHEHLDGIQSKGANGTFVERLVPVGTRLIPTKWVFSVKTKENEVIRFKARVVVQGFRQREGIDFDETFSPTVRSEQVRLLMATAARECGRLRASGDKDRFDMCAVTLAETAATGDCKDAYNTAALDENERLLIVLPPGYEPRLKASNGYRVAGMLETAMPGIRQGGRKWSMHFDELACGRIGFVASKWAPCIYTKRYGTGSLIMGRFVDDLLLVAVGTAGGLRWLKGTLGQHFSIKFDDTIESFVGAQFTVVAGGLLMHLSQYVSNMLAKYDPTGSALRSTPDHRQTDDRDERRLQQADVRAYQSMVGALMFATTTCRPDIAHQVNLLTRRMVDPRMCDVQSVFTLFDYLRGSVGLGILFKFSEDPDHPDFLAYADADWANDSVGRKSTSGYVLLFNRAPVSWYCGLQTVVALSSTEAEYVALSDCAREVIHMRGVLGDMRGQPLARPTPLREDNKGAIDLARNPVHHKRTKHIDVKHHFVRDAETMGAVHIEKVESENNYADIFTKVGSTVLHRFVKDLMYDVNASDN